AVEALVQERDEYQVAADKLAWECKVLRDAAQVTKESIRAAGGIVHSDGNIFFTNITQLQAALTQPEQVKPWVGLTDEEINLMWDNSFVGSDPTSGNQRFKFARAIEAKLKEKNNG
ncbi:MAG: hypothetical protein KGD60_15810, partial [Candidatus Thorarchaeota archaeon]|nr:hypothetical protein [Candidatus Thorarchaeota archaeon]